VNVCAVCGREFQPRRRSDARTCSNACRQRAYRERKDRVELEALVLRHEKALPLVRRLQYDRWDALADVVWPGSELLAASRQAVAA
jgi:hypothetical protein